MAVRLASLLPRVGVLSALVLGASATLTFAAAGTLSTPAPATPAAAPAAPITLTVPDIRNQAFVFAKGILEDEGFAWRVSGAVKGYSTNLVASQSPTPGTKVIDTGAPTITITLARNSHYTQKGTPDDVSPYPATALELAAAARTSKPVTKPQVKHEQAPAKAATTPATTTAAKPASKPAAKTTSKRTPAFVVPGAPKEPLDEMPLPARAERLGTWLNTHTQPTNANVRHLLYQHAWIVTGAKFGWWHGAQALTILIAVDRRTQSLWGIGARNERIARAALAEVEARSR